MNSTGLHTELLEPKRWKEWDTFVLQQRDGTVFHTSIWLDAQPGMSARIYGLFSGEKMVGGAAFCIKEKMGIRIAPQPLITPYFGPVLGDMLIRDYPLSGAIKVLLKEAYGKLDAFCFSIPPQSTQLRKTLNDLPFHEPDRKTVQNLRTNRKAPLSGDDLIASYTRMSRRNEIRRAMRKGVYAEISTDWDIMYQLSENSFRQSDTSHPLTLEQFRNISARMHEFGLCTGILAFNAEGVPLAASMSVHDGHTAYNLIAGVDERYRNLNGGSVALHHLISEAITHQLTFDFGGSMMERVNTYLQSYGPRECWYSHYRSVESSRFGLLRKLGLVRF